MKLPKWMMVAVGLIAVMVLGACGTSNSSPEGATANFFSAFEAEDKDALEDVVCEQYRDSILDFEALEDALEGDIDDDESGELEFRFDLKYNLDEENDDTATVDVYGTIRARTVTESYDTENKRHSRGDNPLFTVALTKDGDDWQVCDEGLISGLTLN